jgi:23S rRNA (uracil1939-C5)-methyltransferase
VAPLILRPSSPAHGGASVAREDGKVWLVSYALPGEVVEAEPRGRQGGVAVAAATRVLEASPHRVAAPCPYFGTCGGCQLQHASYAHQLELKRQVVEEAWARAGLRLPPDVAVLGMDDPWRYRIRGEFEAVAGADGWRFGFHKMRSHSLLAIDSCVIHDARIERALPAFAQAANELQLTGLQNLLLSVEPTGRGLLWRLRFHGREPRWPREEFAHRVSALLPDATLLDDAMTVEFWDLAFRVRSDTFVQTNYRQMLVLYRTASTRGSAPSRLRSPAMPPR